MNDIRLLIALINLAAAIIKLLTVLWRLWWLR